MPPIAASDAGTPPLPWYREVSASQWRAFAAAYLGWVLLGFDFTILTFLLVDIQQSFAINSALAGALGTATLIARVIGGVTTGTAADRWGRKRPLVAAIVWYSTFACLSGFSTTYALLFACRALFGVGMGGVWAAGMPLAIEHWPPRLRGVVSGLLQGGYALGYIVSAVVYQFAYPLVAAWTDAGWRVMLWMGLAPIALAIWTHVRVAESPLWLERQRHLRDAREREAFSLGRLFTRELLVVTLQTSLMMGMFLSLYHAIAFWYPTLLGQLGRQPLTFLLGFNVAALGGNVLVGRLSETRLGRRGAATLATLVSMAAVPLYVSGSTTFMLLAGAMVMGFGTGNFGMVPGYLNERFPTAARATGAGFAYHVGAGMAALAPYAVGALHDGGLTLGGAMGVSIVTAGTLSIVLLWLGPETRGRALT
jgi:SHS family lactate transporter-like MFS transporter